MTYEFNTDRKLKKNSHSCSLSSRICVLFVYLFVCLFIYLFTLFNSSGCVIPSDGMIGDSQIA